MPRCNIPKMNKEVITSAKAEYVSPEDIIEIQKLNHDLLSGYLQERVHSLRGDVFDKLRKHNAVGVGGISWAVFRVTDGYDNSSSLATINPDKEVLILLIPCLPKPMVYDQPVPNIRIITNELCIGEDNRLQYLSFDFTLDGEDDVQYCVDATDVVDLGRSNTPLFWVDKDGDLCSTPNLRLFTPVGTIDTITDGSVKDCFPFGHFSSLNDSLHALDVGRKLFEEVRFVEPTYCYRQKH